MKIIVKKNLVIFRNPYEWEDVSRKIIETYGPSMMISWKMKRELGFTVRRHKGLVKYGEENTEWKKYVDEEWANRFHYEDQVHLDFYSESAMTYFLLKYAKSDPLDI